MTKLWILSLMIAPVLFAQDDSQRRCGDVGGSISTNFIDPTDTLISATGDLGGGLGVHVLSVTAGPNGTTILNNHHHWVTVQGDTILFDDADATLFPTPIAGLFAASYLKGVVISGGTGRFANATGNLTSTYGAVDLNEPGLLQVRYIRVYGSAAEHQETKLLPSHGGPERPSPVRTDRLPGTDLSGGR